MGGIGTVLGLRPLTLLYTQQPGLEDADRFQARYRSNGRDTILDRRSRRCETLTNYGSRTPPFLKYCASNKQRSSRRESHWSTYPIGPVRLGVYGLLPHSGKECFHDCVERMLRILLSFQEALPQQTNVLFRLARWK